MEESQSSHKTKKRVYLSISEFGDILGYYTNAKKCYDSLSKGKDKWIDEIHYSLFQRTISKQNNRVFTVLSFESNRKYFVRFQVIYEL